MLFLFKIFKVSYFKILIWCKQIFDFLFILKLVFLVYKRHKFQFIYPHTLLLRKIQDALNYVLEYKHRQEKYKNLLVKFRQKVQSKDHSKIKVYFMVYDTSLWSCDELYKLLSNDSLFLPQIVCLPLNYKTAHFKDDPHCLERYKNTLAFFRDKGYPVLPIYNEETEDWVDLEKENIDFLFYTICGTNLSNYEPSVTGAYCIPIYIPYGIMAASNQYKRYPFENLQFNKPEHNWMYKVILETQTHLELKKQYCDLEDSNSIVLGYPKLDSYLKPISSIEDPWNKINGSFKKRIIWAPHHTITQILSPSTYAFGAIFSTFDKNYKFFKEHIKNNPDIIFCFKPHPCLKSTLIHYHFMTEEQYASYFNELFSLPNVIEWDQGDYIDLFRRSDAMITDSVSFLSEYLPSQKPLLFLENDWHAFNKFGEKIIEAHYRCKGDNFSEIERFMEQVVINGQDPLLKTRQNVFEKSGLLGEEYSSKRIYSFLKKEVQIGQD